MGYVLRKKKEGVRLNLQLLSLITYFAFCLSFNEQHLALCPLEDPAGNVSHEVGCYGRTSM
jgi:hypothetical protein